MTNDAIARMLAAAARGSVDCARLLLERGADPGERSSQGQNALEVARSCKQQAMVELLERNLGAS